MPVGADVQNVKETLDILRETPADTAAASDAVLAGIYAFLMKVPSSLDGLVHWFCNKADATTIDAATFLIRLMAYNSPQVVEWKIRLHRCLSSCAFCAQGLEIAKTTSQNTFLAAFSQDILKAFFNEFDKWEVKEVLEDLHKNSAVAQTPSSDVSAATMYRMVSNWAIFCNPEVLFYLQTHTLVKSAEDWPDHPLPAGLLILLLVANPELRSWAAVHASRSRMIDPSLFTGSYSKAMELVIHIMKTSCSSPSSDSKSFTAETKIVADHLPFAHSIELWSGFHALLRLIPPEWFGSNSGLPLELKRIVFGHLQDKEPYFIEVFRCFTLLMKRLAKDVWSGEGPEYPQSVFEAITGNPFYAELLSSASSDSASSNLAWIQEYLSTVRSCSFYGSVFGKTVNSLFEDAQHERFQKSRPSLMKFLTRTLHKELQRSRVDNNSANTLLLLRTLRIHFGTLLSLAYGQNEQDQEWKTVKDLAQSLVNDFLRTDVQSLESAITSLCRILSQKKRRTVCDELPTLSIQATTWKTFYSTIRTSDVITSAVCIVSKVAHIDFLKDAVFAKQWDFSAGNDLVKEVNQAIRIIQDGFSETISSFAEYSVSSNAIDILQRPGVGKAVTLLLLSPVEDYQTAGKTLVGLAFDVDGRMDCFRSLLENLSTEALDGIFEFLTNFHGYASKMPEASSLSAALVRCFADILDVLCASPDGLLHSSYFLRSKEPTGPASRMHKFWNLLTKSLCIIYSRASMWAQYIDTPDMVLWMRDALILARDVLNQWKVIENASNASLEASSKSTKRGETSPVGRQMIEALQDFLPELIRWLRLTDEELLHQSFSLLQSLFDLMKETHVRPSESALEKLGKHVEGARSMDKEAREQKTRLDRGRLLQLSEVLAYFKPDKKDDDDDEVIIVSHTKPAQRPASEKLGPKSGADNRTYIQGKFHPPKPANRPTQATIPFTTTRTSGSKGFTEKDQRKLESTAVVPSFRKSGSNTVTAGPSRTIPDNRRPLTKTGPKNEALNIRAQSSEESSSSSSESDDGVGVEAFRDPRPKSPRKPKPVERRQIKTLEIPTKNHPAQDRFMRNKQAHYNAMRMRPDISDLHRIILSWDYKHVGPIPPGKPLKLLSIPGRFESYDHYFRVFRPLLLMECWAQLQQSKEETQDAYECKVDSRQYVDDWLDIDITISESVKRDWYLAETDVVILRQPGHEKCSMGKVKSYRALPTGILAVVRCYIQGETGDPGLQISTLWQLSKVLSLSTLHREYGALVSLQYNDMCGFILRPSLPVAPDVSPKDLGETMENYKLNKPQAVAILKAMKTQGISLIQGPPGTGKTSTICGLIARFLSQRPRAAVPIVVGKTAPSMLSRNTTSPPSAPTARILVCAPSNAAIDELAQRIKDGFIGSQRKSNPMNIVRIGADQAISATVRDISLDYLVDQKLDGTPKPFNDIGNDIRSIRQELESVKQSRLLKMAELTTIAEPTARKTALENEVKVLNSRRQTLISKLDAQKDKQKSDSRTLDTLRRNTRREVITQADVICSTLSGAGHDILENLEFDMIIIDEAAQAIELSSLIPLKYACTRCVMVGDPQQLPPTVLSQEASRFGYNQSLFVRLQQSQKDAINLLSIQYRMHPDISCLPSQIFYDGRLLDGPDMAEKTKQPWHTHAKFGTYKFLNVSWGIEESNGHSIKNSAECNIAVELYNRLRRDFSSTDFTLRIGVVSMYKAQIRALRKIFVDRFGNDVLSKIGFNTVDGFQGQEKDIIILSCVRAGPGLQNVGFLSDIRRMNVALTRAKSSLFILGHTPTLERSDPTWRKIIQDARTRSALVNIDATYFSRPISPGESKEVLSKEKARLTKTFPVPSDLSTPQELKTAVERGMPLRTASPLIPPSNPQHLDIGTLSSSSSHPELTCGIKRPLETEISAFARSSPPNPGPSQNNPTIVTSNIPPSNSNLSSLQSSAISQTTPIASSSSLVPPGAHGTKRPLDAEGSNSASTKPPRPGPPRKKPKQQTMFIPKKRT